MATRVCLPPPRALCPASVSQGRALLGKTFLSGGERNASIRLVRAWSWRRAPGPSATAARCTASAEAAPAAVIASFTVPACRLCLGEGLRVVGGCTELGSWDPQASRLALQWGEGHTWTGSVALPAGQQFEFKLVKTLPDGGVQWEAGANRSLAVPQDGSVGALHVTASFDDPASMAVAAEEQQPQPLLEAALPAAAAEQVQEMAQGEQGAPAALQHDPLLEAEASTEAAAAAVGEQERLAGAAAGVAALFTVPACRLHLGEGLHVVGGCGELGSWDPQASRLALQWGEGHTWTGSVALPAGQQFEFKLVKMLPDGGVQWEAGANRSLAVPEAGSVGALHVTASFDDPASTAVAAEEVALAVEEEKEVQLEVAAALAEQEAVQLPQGEAEPETATQAEVTVQAQATAAAQAEEERETAAEEAPAQPQVVPKALAAEPSSEQPAATSVEQPQLAQQPQLQQQPQPTAAITGLSPEAEERVRALAAAAASGPTSAAAYAAAAAAAAPGRVRLPQGRVRDTTGGDRGAARERRAGASVAAPPTRNGVKLLGYEILATYWEYDLESDGLAWEQLEAAKEAHERAGGSGGARAPAGALQPERLHEGAAPPAPPAADALAPVAEVEAARDESLVYRFEAPAGPATLTAAELAEQRLLEALPPATSAALRLMLHGRPPKPAPPPRAAAAPAATPGPAAADVSSTGAGPGASVSNSAMRKVRQALDFAALRGGFVEGSRPPPGDDAPLSPLPGQQPQQAGAGGAGEDSGAASLGVPAPATVPEVSLSSVDTTAPAPAVPDGPVAAVAPRPAAPPAPRLGLRSSLPAASVILVAASLYRLGDTLWGVGRTVLPPSARRPADIAFWALFFLACVLPLWRG